MGRPHQRNLNDGLLPDGYYALAEQVTGGRGPDVLTLTAPLDAEETPSDQTGGVAVASPVEHHVIAEPDYYAGKANRIAIRHRSGDKVIAVIELVSPGNKSSRKRFEAFIDKALDVLSGGIHLLVVDVFRKGSFDPDGLHRAIGSNFGTDDFSPTARRPLMALSYLAGEPREAFVSTFGVGEALPDMPLFLSRQVQVILPLEKSYNAAWDRVPKRWRDVLS